MNSICDSAAWDCRGTSTTPASRVTLDSTWDAVATSAFGSSARASKARCRLWMSPSPGGCTLSSVLTKNRYPLSVGMRPAEVCGEATKPCSSRSAITLRTVAELSCRPDSRDSTRDPTGWPSRM